MTDLKPCPFCGCEMEIHNVGETLRLNGVDYHDDSYTWWHVDMKLAAEKDCPLVHEFHDTEDGLIRSWNNRAERTCELKMTTCGWACSSCHVVSWETTHKPKPNYCPNCGAKVVE